MMKLNLQMFGGDGGSAGVAGIPSHLTSDTVYQFDIIITNGAKIENESFIGTQWEAEQKMINYIENKLNMDYKQYMRQSKYSYVASIRPGFGGSTDYKVMLEDQVRRGIITESDKKMLLKQYKERKKSFYKRYKEYRRNY